MSRTIEWKDEYSVGVDRIDHQHQELFAIINRLAAAVESMPAPTAASATMHEMSKYLDKHFTAEEQFLERHPEFDRHHLAHLEFIEKTLDFQIRFADHDRNLHMEMLAFLISWLKEHILETDKKYFSYLHDNKLLDR
ncbi:MAG: bacteriohemerythrin [Desulfobulbaceae bacterium]|nr:bacteriohemerythrin [Desulfobulbaceae bacterium]